MRRPGWTFAIVSVALFMVVLDNLVVTTALPSIRADLGATIQSLEWTVNAYTLSYAVLLLTGAALGDRFGRRRMFVLGLGLFTLASAAAALAPTTAALIGARAIQGVGAAIVTPLTLTLLADAVPARAARPGHRRLVRHLRPRRRARPAGRRRGRRRHLVALDLLDQRADRPGPAPARRAPADREPRPRPLARPAGRRPGQRRPAGHRLRHRPRRRAGLDEHHRARRADRRRRRSSSRSSSGSARAAADAAAALLPLARLRGRQRRVAGDVLRRLRLDLPAGPVLPGHAGLLAARGRSADAAVDDHADVHRADRGHAVGPHRLAPADGDRARAAGRRDRLARLGVDPDRALRRARDPVHHGRHRHGAGLRPGRQRRARLGAPGGGRPGLGRDERDPRARRRPRRRGAGHRVRAQRLVRVTRRLHRRHDGRDLGRRRGPAGRRARRAVRAGPPPRRPARAASRR